MGMSGGGKTTTNSTTTPQVPAFISGSQQDYVSRVGKVANNWGDSVTPATPQQQQAFNFTGSQGTGALGSLLGYQPGQIATTDLSKYTNPFENQVVNASLDDNERAREVAINQGQSQATAQGAFGGSRHGVADSLTNQDYLRNAGTLASNLRMAGYTNAQNMAGQDIQTDLAGAGVRLNAANAQASNQRADTALQADLGEQLRQLMARANPNSVESLQALQSLLGYNPSMYVGSTTNSTTKTPDNVLGGLGSLLGGVGALGFSPLSSLSNLSNAH